jgi:biotin carboxylase
MKKLLVLGANYIEIELVTEAKSLGIYTIVTDNRPNRADSPAKQVADEAWDISWSDIDALEVKCREDHVDGVLAGFSEFRVDCMIWLCNRLGLPCGINADQLEVTRDKVKFKRLCEAYDIKTVPEYSYPKIPHFPVIIKPVDRAGSIGINVAYNKEQCETFYQQALSLSPSKHVIVEDFINDGTKFDVYYFVKSGIPYLLGTSDTIMCKGSEGAEILQKAWTFPSIRENQYLDEFDAKVKRMLVGIGIKDCYATMSAFYWKGDFYFFEAGFRLSGELSNHYYKALSGINYDDVLIRYAIGEQDNTVFSNANTLPKMYSVILNYFGKDGVANKVTRVEELKIPELVNVNYFIRPGEKNVNKTRVLSKILMLTFCSPDLQRLLSAVDNANLNVFVEDINHCDMIYERVTNDELGSIFKNFN